MRLLCRQLSILGIEVEDAGEVRGVANVHGISQRLYAGLGMVLSRLQILVENVVGIVGSNETLDTPWPNPSGIANASSTAKTGEHPHPIRDSPVTAPQIASSRPVPIFLRMNPLAEADTDEHNAIVSGMNPPYRRGTSNARLIGSHDASRILSGSPRLM